MRRKGFWPVMEGKHIEQFLVGIAPVRWWLSVQQAKSKYDKTPRDSRTLVFRETAANTNERTCIAAVLPAGMAASHKLSGILLEEVSIDAAASVLNSFCFDYCLRFRTAGTSISFTYIRPMPVPAPEIVNQLPKITSGLAWDGGLEHISSARENWPKLWELTAPSPRPMVSSPRISPISSPPSRYSLKSGRSSMPICFPA